MYDPRVMSVSRLVIGGSCAAICLGFAGSAGAAHGPGSVGTVTPLRVSPPLRKLQPGCTARPFSDGGGTLWVQTCFVR